MVSKTLYLSRNEARDGGIRSLRIFLRKLKQKHCLKLSQSEFWKRCSNTHPSLDTNNSAWDERTAAPSLTPGHLLVKPKQGTWTCLQTFDRDSLFSRVLLMWSLLWKILRILLGLLCTRRGGFNSQFHSRPRALTPPFMEWSIPWIQVILPHCPWWSKRIYVSLHAIFIEKASARAPSAAISKMHI